MTRLLRRLKSSDPTFAEAFEDFVTEKREVDTDVSAAVGAIVADVRARADAALLELTERFDKVRYKADDLRVTEEEIERARASCDPKSLEAMALAAERIRAFHARQVPEDYWTTDDMGVGLGARWTAIEAVGLYVPGGTASYPSSVLMNAIPAQVAGSRRIVMVTPAPEGRLNPLVLAAAGEAGVTEIYRVGGAQAVAALAYGTETIAPVDKIVGPGNAYVAEAKRQVFGTVGIDMVAGPSEILVVADADNDPAWIAADLLSQAEHDESAQSILITDSSHLAEKVEVALEAELADLPRRSTAAKSLEQFGALIEVTDLEAEAPALVDRLAPEHLELAVKDPESLAGHVRNAGAIFPRPPYAGGHWRLCRRDQPCSADRAFGTVRVWPVGARFRQAHIARSVYAG